MHIRSIGWLIALVAASSALSLAACGEEDGDATAPKPRRLSDAQLRTRIEGTGNGRTEDDIVVRVRAVDRPGGPRFADDRPTVKMGAIRLQLVNRRTAPNEHAIALLGHGISKNDFGGAPGRASYIRADLGPGRYEFFCINHRAEGMSGTLTVVRDPAFEAKLAR